MCRGVPLPVVGSSQRVLARSLRIGMFHKNQLVSNVYHLRAEWNDKEEDVWKFVDPGGKLSPSGSCHKVRARH